MKGENSKQPSATVSAIVPVPVKSALQSTAKKEDRNVSFVTARILEAWATGRPLPYRKRKAS